MKSASGKPPSRSLRLSPACPALSTSASHRASANGAKGRGDGATPGTGCAALAAKTSPRSGTNGLGRADNRRRRGAVRRHEATRRPL